MAEFKHELYQIGVVDMEVDYRPDLRMKIANALVNAGFIVADDTYSQDIHILIYKEDR